MSGETTTPDDSQNPPREPFWYRLLFRETDISSLVFLRIAYGLVMSWEMWSFFAEGRIGRYFVEPSFHFAYFGFEWISPLPGEGMYLLFVGLGVLSVCITLVFFYRLSASLFFVGYTYAFLAEQAAYQNHYYLICFLMIFVPANAALSLDAKFGLTKPRGTIAAWPIQLIRFQVGVVYFYGGLAKLSPDWLLHGEPMRMWLHSMRKYPLIGPYLTVWIYTYGGIIFDLLIPFLLAWRRTRVVAFGVVVLFHVNNAVMFDIGVFPLMAIVLSTVFLSPDWFRNIVDRRWLPKSTPSRGSETRSWKSRRENVLAAGIIVWVAVQCLVPMRRHLYPGNVNWTEQGHRFSWRMKLRDKRAKVTFLVWEKGRPMEIVEPTTFLTRFQTRRSMNSPDMILQAAHHLAALENAKRQHPVEVYAVAWVSLNGRPHYLMIDPQRDLTTVHADFRFPDWLLPMNASIRDAETQPVPKPKETGKTPRPESAK